MSGLSGNSSGAAETHIKNECFGGSWKRREQGCDLPLPKSSQSKLKQYTSRHRPEFEEQTTNVCFVGYNTKWCSVLMMIIFDSFKILLPRLPTILIEPIDVHYLTAFKRFIPPCSRPDIRKRGTSDKIWAPRRLYIHKYIYLGNADGLPLASEQCRNGENIGKVIEVVRLEFVRSPRACHNLRE